MKKFAYKSFSSLLSAVATLTAVTGVAAQVIPDDSLGSDRSIMRERMIERLPSKLIEGGAERGSNLFHSFQEFNVKAGEGVYFANPDSVNNIFSRITGSEPSRIFGRLGVLGDANLFLLNPNGIIFGPNATLDVNGSFLGTTAESINFADGTEFSAANPQEGRLLTVTVPPIGLRFADPGEIRVRGSGHKLGFNSFSPTQNLNPNRLQVQTGQTLSLIGGNVAIEGGVLSTQGGHVELGSIEQGNVRFTTSPKWDFNYEEVRSFQDIQLAARSAVDASGFPGGSINVRGDRVSISGGSTLFIQSQSANPSGGIKVDASLLEVQGGVVREFRVVPGSSFEQLLEQRGTEFEPGQTIKTFVPSSIFTETLDSGKGAKIEISVDKLNVTGGAQIISRTFGNAPRGDRKLGGDINVDASQSVRVDDFARIPEFIENGFVIFSAINSANFGLASGGDINLSVPNLQVSEGGSISSSSFSPSSNTFAGNVNINTNKIAVEGVIPEAQLRSNIASVAYDEGGTGNLAVDSTKLFLRNGGTLNTSSVLGTGFVGKATLEVSEQIQVQGTGLNSRLPSTIGAIVVPATPGFQRVLGDAGLPEVSSGTLFIDTPTLKVSDGGVVGVFNVGSRDAGTQNLTADTVTLDGGGQITADSDLAGGGNINLEANRVDILDQSSISATARSDGGNVDVNTNTVAILGNSEINANAVRGRGGNIRVDAEGLFRSPNSSVTASSQFNVDGTVEIQAPENNLENELVELSGEFINPEAVLADNCLGQSNLATGRFITGTGGIPTTPFSGIEQWDLFSEDLPVPSAPAEGQQSSSGERTETRTSQKHDTWELGDPIRTVIITEEGRFLLSEAKKRAKPKSAQSLTCSPK